PAPDNTLDAGIINDPPIHPPPDNPPQVTNMVGDYVWWDQNVNGIQDAGEPGMFGVAVQLLDSEGNIAASTITDPSGHYSFIGLVPNEWYQIAVQIPTGYKATLQGQATSDIDSDIGADGITSTFWLGPDTVDLTIDAGLVYGAGTGSVGDRVWLDDNQNGLQDNGELGFANVEVRLLDEADTVLRTTQTDRDGLYSFDNLVPSTNYRIEFVAPQGRQFTVQNAGPPDQDSDPDPATGKTELFQIQAGEQKKDIDAGIKGAGTAATIEFVIPGGWLLDSATKELKIAKWQWENDDYNAFYKEGSNLRLKQDPYFVNILPDRFKIRVRDAQANTDPKSVQTRSMTLSVIGFAGLPGVVDPPRTIQLKEISTNSPIFETPWQILVSHTADKSPAPLRTSKARLDSLALAKYKTAAGQTISATASVPAKKVLKVNIKQLTLNTFTYIPIVKNPEVKQDVQYTQENLAQVGIRVQVVAQDVIKPPPGVVLDRKGDSGLSVLKQSLPAPKPDLSAEIGSLLGAPLAPKAVRDSLQINVYYANYLTADDQTENQLYYGVALDDKGYPVVLLSGRPVPGRVERPQIGTHGYTTLSHELCHTLGLQPGTPDHHWPVAGADDVLNKVNLMVDGTYSIEWGIWKDSRRLTIEQQGVMYAHPVKWLTNAP
ncbi:MAG TPA: SdrD B-like domain-containing protein, partial [Gemmataceae bacterium]|nr:SdrD B-like domain-containing protein [Gemmataceae bacterium]